MINMKPMDLLELYQLTELYKRTYKPCMNVTVQEMLDTITERYAFQTKGEDIRAAHNPRGAGRPKIHGPKTVRKILDLRKNGKTMRVISEEIGCSLYYVQRVISQNR